MRKLIWSIALVLSLIVIGLFLNTNRSVFVEARYTGNHHQGTVHIDFDGFNTAEEAVKHSDVICYGRVIEVKKPEGITVGMIPNPETGEDEPFKLLYTVAVVEVIDGIKGDYNEGDILEIKQLGSDSYGYDVDPRTTKHCKESQMMSLL